MNRFRVAAIVMLALALASCSGTAEGLASATGKVVRDGQPAARALLFFHRQSGEPAPPPCAAGVIPLTTTGDNGTFTVESASLRGTPVVAAAHDKLEPIPLRHLEGPVRRFRQAPAQRGPERSGDPRGLAPVTRFPDPGPSIY
jgi:hypothetical protein